MQGRETTLRRSARAPKSIFKLKSGTEKLKNDELKKATCPLVFPNNPMINPIGSPVKETDTGSPKTVW